MNKLDKIITDSLFEGLNKINTELSADSFFELKEHIYNNISKQLNLCAVGKELKDKETITFGELKHLENKHNVLNEVSNNEEPDLKLWILEDGEWVEVNL